jgi:hypothetical protein
LKWLQEEKEKKYRSSAPVTTKSTDKNKKKPSKISDAQREKIRQLKRESDGLDYLSFLALHPHGTFCSENNNINERKLQLSAKITYIAQ